MKRHHVSIAGLALILLGGCVISCNQPASIQEQQPAPQGQAALSSTKPGHRPRHGRRKGKWLKRVRLPEHGLLQGTVVHVVDGDTVHVRLDSGWLVNVRMAGINAPECHKERTRTLDGRWSARCVKDDEGGGLDSYIYLRDLIQGRRVSLDCERKRPGSRACKTGNYGRLLGFIILDGKDINEEMVRAGWAFSFTKYPSSRRARYCRAEFEARRARRGIWKLAPDVKGVLALMSYKTRRWYREHDRLCHKAMGTQGRRPQ